MPTLAELYPAYGIRPVSIGGNLGGIAGLAALAQARGMPEGGGLSQLGGQVSARPTLASLGMPAAPATPSVAAAAPEDFTRWIMGQEGFRDQPYGDYRQTSIGYGTRARPGETSITQADAMTRLNDEIGNARSLVRRFSPNLSPSQENALTDLTFNAGGDWMQSGLGQAVRAGNWPEAQRLFQQYINAGGQPLDALRRRRAAAAPWLMGY